MNALAVDLSANQFGVLLALLIVLVVAVALVIALLALVYMRVKA